MEKSARTYTITEETLDKVKAEIMKQFEKYAMMGIKAKYNEEILSAINGFQGAAIAASIFVKLAPDDYPVDELIKEGQTQTKKWRKKLRQENVW